MIHLRHTPFLVDRTFLARFTSMSHPAEENRQKWCSALLFPLSTLVLTTTHFKSSWSLARTQFYLVSLRIISHNTTPF